MQTNVREGTHVWLSKFHRKSEKDVTAWYKEVERVARANNWKAGRIYTIVAASLREAAVDYFEKESSNIIS